MKNGTRKTKKNQKIIASELSQAAEEMTAQQNGSSYINLTLPLSTKEEKAFAGPGNVNLTKLSENFSGVPFEIVEKRISVSQKEIDARSGNDPGLLARITSVCRALEGIVLSGDLINETNILQIVQLARRAQEDALLKTTGHKKGKKLDKLDIEIPEFRDSEIFSSVMTQTTCPEDPDFGLSQTLQFLPSGNSVYSRMVSDGGQYLKAIATRVGDVKFTTNGSNMPEITVSGNSEKFPVAWEYLINFANLIAEHGYKKKDHLRQALDCACGESAPQSLPSAKQETKKKGGKRGFDPSSLTINKLIPRTPNQATLITLFKNDSYDAVIAQGPAGTGKTILFLQEALDKVLAHYRGEEGANFKKLILLKPLVESGEELGAVPGNEMKKTQRFLKSYYDHMEYLLAPNVKGKLDMKAGAAQLDMLMEAGIIEIELLGSMRGMNYKDALIALDEAQNSLYVQVKTLLTRAQEGSRVVILGDLGQMDREVRYPLKGKSFLVPQTVDIREGNNVFINKFGSWINSGKADDFGEFTMSATIPNGVETFIPKNGLAAALLLYSAYKNVACFNLNKSDIQRSRLAWAVATLDEGLSVPKNRAGSMMGRGIVDPYAILGDDNPDCVKSEAVIAFANRPVLVKKQKGSSDEYNAA